MTDFDQLQAQDTVYALAAGPDGLCYAGRASGLYRSTDYGANWVFAYETLESETPLTTTSVALAADGSVFAGVNGGVLRSSDGGVTWYGSGLSTPPPLVTALVVSPDYEQDGLILAGTAEDGVFSSADRGVNWSPWNFGLIDLNVYSLALSPDFAHDQTAYAGTETGIFRSTNGGRAWRGLPFPIDAAPILSLAAAPDGRLFAGTEHSGLYASTDRGATWQRVDAAGPITGGVNSIVLLPPHLWLLLDDRVLMSPDHGATWQHEPAYTLDVQGLALAVIPGTPVRLLVGLAEGGVQRLG